MSDYNFKPNYLCDMHCHTTRSDGLCTPKELIDLAAKSGMKVLTISDHDMLPPKTVEVDGKEVDSVEYAKNKGVNLLKACEFSCDTDVDDVHMVAYGCDFEDKKIKEVMEDIANSKIESYKDFLKRLNECGYEISLDEVLNYGGQQRSEKELQKKLIFNLMADKGYTKTWSDAKKLSKKDERLNVRRRKPTPVDIIKIVHDAGGIIVLAHPYLIADKVVLDGKEVSRSEYIENLIKNGLDGVEASYTYDKTSYTGNMKKEDIINEVRDTYKDKVKIISGGSDFHGDHKKDSENPRFIGECGIDYDYFINNELLKKLI